MKSHSKAISFSLAFHILMVTLALMVLKLPDHRHSSAIALPLQQIQLVSLSEASSVVPSPVPDKPAITPPTPAPVHYPLPSSIKPIPDPVAVTKPKAPQNQTLPVISEAPVPLSPSADASAITASSEPQLPKSTSKPAPPPPPAATRPKDTSAAKQAFFSQLRSKIQSRLVYPSAARRRGMQGEVDVRFFLEKHGLIHDISVQSGPSIFHESARLAVASASGIAIPEPLIDAFPTEIRLTLEFTLN